MDSLYASTKLRQKAFECLTFIGKSWLYASKYLSLHELQVKCGVLLFPRKWNKKWCVKDALRHCCVIKILGISMALWYSGNFQKVVIILINSRKCMKKYLCSLPCYFIFGCRDARKPFKILIKVAIYAINPHAFLNQDCRQRTLNQKHVFPRFKLRLCCSIDCI